ncbi:hypothetical protein [Bacillus salipaludis]|uniref:Uncharacterized protein n=1 Tax=Bacillus salipaludis TaxID=2547811 RepID=A0ABW8RLR0_9BACI
MFLFLDWTLHRRKSFKQKVIENGMSLKKEEVRKVFTFIAAIILFICSILIVNKLHQKGFLFSVVMVMIPFSIFWASFIYKLKRFGKTLLILIKRNTLSLHSLFFLFLSAGFFIDIIQTTAFLNDGIIFLKLLNDLGNTFVFYTIVALFIVGISLVGLHPLISITLLIPFLETFLKVDTMILPLIILASCVTVSLISPFSLSISLLSINVKENPFRITSYNFFFAISFLLFNLILSFVLS